LDEQKIDKCFGQHDGGFCLRSCWLLGSLSLSRFSNFHSQTSRKSNSKGHFCTSHVNHIIVLELVSNMSQNSMLELVSEMLPLEVNKRGKCKVGRD
jgi:hypothetical protein